jgi:isoleucyl-tRNA synthetase
MYRPVPAQVDLPAMEREILQYWQSADIFGRSLRASAEAPPWVFYEGPPTANGLPGTHHVEARVFKDVFPRYKTMKGFHVPRKAGWDCHGLPVELAVEKELGFSGKGDIERYGVAEFNARCRESVERHVGEFEAMTERMGYWVDMSQAYRTMDPGYVEAVWWSLKRIFDRGLLALDHRVSPYCPRCGTGLSDHEIAQGYETVTDPSVYVRFPITSGPLAQSHPGAALLVWTTTPWTLVSNTAVAAHPQVGYVVAEVDGELLVVAEPLLDSALGEGAQVRHRLTGSELAGTGYARPFDLIEVPAGEHVHRVVTADYVTTEDGSGLVHLAPAFGAEDMAVGRQYGLPVVNPVGADGHFGAEVPLVGGQFFRKADEDLVADLAARGLLQRHLPYEHAYPHCWRCHTPLINYAQPAWYIRTTEIKADLLRENAATTWYPATIKDGRYGDWLDNNVDWALSRDRYWGTPLPIWRCGSDPEHLQCVGSLSELGALAGQELSALDPHRPYVDDVALPCDRCDGTAHRVPQVIDCWYDSGAMPFAQWGYPHAGEAEFAEQYPADFICEAIDQTRGWFYTLMAVGTLVFDQSSYRTVLCLGHILDESGRKMSKHLGNVLEPIGLMDAHGADAVRWFMACAGSPWQARRVGHAAIEDVVRKTLLTLWNAAAFQSLYARAADWSPQTGAVPAIDSRPLMDRWALSQRSMLVAEVDAALDDFDTQRAGRAIGQFVDDLSNWYVRRSRRRFWEGDPAALATLHECLRDLLAVMAPITPFVTERLWSDLVAATDPAAPESVHLAGWPSAEGADPGLAEGMGLVRRLVELGRAARAESSVKTRQPLPRALVAADGWGELPDELRAEVAEELNVIAVADLRDAGELLDHQVKANFRELGRRFAADTPRVAAAVADADAADLVAALRASSATVSVPGLGEVALSAADVIVTETPRSGWAVASESGATVALDLQITAELRRAGIARDAVRMIQEARKSAGLEVTDRIDLWWSADGEIAEALHEHAAGIAAETLATLQDGPGPDDAAVAAEGGLTIRLVTKR